ncbi:MAG: PrsW family intramembrane metalloprotease, partial [Ruminococcus sp.]|nr:PrsW family intramembrane metalloprotease [Ruminococcus sp.]
MDKILLAAAILPAVILLLYIRSKDRIEKEPWGLLIKLFALGALTTISAIILELLGTSVIDSFLSKGTVEYNLINNFLIIALAEESGKFFALKLRTWNEPEFNFTYDAVVYAVAVSLGFATLENILYVLGEGTMGIAIMRGLLSVPGHAIDSVFMGYYYGLAQRCRYMNNASGARRNLFKALLAPVLIHGFYDFTLSMKSDIFMGIFFLFEIIITIVSIVKVNKLSREDTPLSPFLNNPYFQQNMYQQNPYQQNP